MFKRYQKKCITHIWPKNKLIVSNWKMNLDLTDAKKLILQINKNLKKKKKKLLKIIRLSTKSSYSNCEQIIKVFKYYFGSTRLSLQ